MTRASAVLVVAALLAGCGGDARVEPAEAASCLGEDGITTAPRGDPGAVTEVLAFRIPAAPAATNGLLIFVVDAGEAERLEEDIADEARSQGDEAHLVREGNAIAHFLTTEAPRAAHVERIRRCLE